MSLICYHLPLAVTGTARTSCPSPSRRATRASSTSSPAFWDLKFPHHHGRVARRENPRREAAPDYRPGGHDGVVADAAARQHEHAVTEPDVFTDKHGTGLVWVTGVKLVIIRIVYRREVADQGVIT